MDSMWRDIAQHEWAAKATQNLIHNVVPPGCIHKDTKLLMANAVYFRGKWDLLFDESATETWPFYRLDGTAIDVPFMKNNSSHYVAEHDGFKVLMLCYKISDYTAYHSMCIFLPDALDGLSGPTDKITSSAGFLHKHLPKREIKLRRFGVPKFKLCFESSIAGILVDLGIRLPFSEEANMSDMLEDDGGYGLPFFMQDVFQKAVIEVNEEGTRAAAVTTVHGYSPTCPAYSPPVVDFVADHPFAYFIVEAASETILFAGHVVDPSNGTGVVIASLAPFQQRSATNRKFDEDGDDNSKRASWYGPISPPSSPYSPTSPLYRPQY